MSQDLKPNPESVVAAVDHALRHFGNLVPIRDVLNASKAGYPARALMGMTGLDTVTARLDFDCVPKESKPC